MNRIIANAVAAVAVVLGAAAPFGAVAHRGAVAHAQRITGHLPNPDLQSISPAGVEAGGSVSVRVAGRDLDQPRELRFSHPGLSATPEETSEKSPAGRFTVTAAETIAPGVYEARVLGKYGLSTPRGFVVGALPERSEQESNDALESAEPLAVETTVNATLGTPGDIDRFRVSLAAGQRVVFHCAAQRLDSPAEPVMRLRDAEGTILRGDHDTVHRGGLIDFTPETTGEFFVDVRDLLHEGGTHFTYRLTASSRPYIDCVFPPAGQRGRTRSFTVFGRNLPGGQRVPGMAISGRPLERVEVDVAVADRPERNGVIDAIAAQRIGYHVTAPHPLTEVVSYPLPGETRSLNRMLIGVSDQPVQVEGTSNDAPEQAESLTVPVEIAGRFYPLDDRDWYQFEAQKGDALEIDVVSQRLGIATDPFLVVQQVLPDGTTKDIAEVDDQTLLGYDQNVGGFQNVGRFAFNSRTDDPTHSFVAPADGTYRVLVRELNHTTLASPDFVYRLSIRPPAPDFTLVATPHTPVDLAPNFRDFYPWTPVVRRGGTERVDLQAFRWGTFDGAIRVEAEGLPEGVRCEPAVIGPDQTFAPLVFHAEADTPLWSGPVRIVAEAEIGGEVVRRVATAGTVLWKGTTLREGPQSRIMSDLPLSVIESPAPLKVVGPDKPIRGTAGETINVPVKLQRGSFDGPVQITNIGLPKQVVSTKPMTIAKGESEGTVALTISDGAKPTETSFCLDAKVDLPDPRVADPEQAKSLAILISSTPVRVEVVEADKAE